MNSRTRLAALTVSIALLLVFAGCSGGMTTNANETANISADQYPPGVAENGTLTDVNALFDAHYNQTADEPISLTINISNPNASTVFHYIHGADGMPTYYAVNRTKNDNRRVTEFFKSGSNAYVRAGYANTEEYIVAQNVTVQGAPAPIDNGRLSPGTYLVTTLANGNYSVDGVVERNGRTLVRLTADEVSPAGKNRRTMRYEGTALVTPDGVVYTVNANYDLQIDGSTTHYEQSNTLDTEEVWTGPPSWTDDLPHLAVSIVEDGHALELQNTGGEVLPADVTFRVSTGNATGTVITHERLEPGDSFYVTANTNGNTSSFSLHEERMRGTYEFEEVTITGEDENIFYRLSPNCAEYSPCQNIFD